MEFTIAEETRQARHSAGEKTLKTPRRKGHREVRPRDLQWARFMSALRYNILSNRRVFGPKRVVVRRHVNALVEEVLYVVPFEIIIANFFSPAVVAASGSSLIDHLVANTAAANGLALGIVDGFAL